MAKDAYGRVPVEDVLHEMLFGGPPVPGYSFEPVVRCFKEAVLRAKQEERQAILDEWLKARRNRERKGREWTDAFATLNRILAERAQADYQQSAGESPQHVTIAAVLDIPPE